FMYEERPLQSTEVTRGRYTTASGPDANCQLDMDEVRAQIAGHDHDHDHDTESEHAHDHAH
ncbi:MAG TPA: hypothetical protein VIH55_02195, partial [Acidimicrobiia bacterium]